MLFFLFLLLVPGVSGISTSDKMYKTFTAADDNRLKTYSVMEKKILGVIAVSGGICYFTPDICLYLTSGYFVYKQSCSIPSQSNIKAPLCATGKIIEDKLLSVPLNFYVSVPRTSIPPPSESSWSSYSSSHGHAFVGSTPRNLY